MVLYNDKIRDTIGKVAIFERSVQESESSTNAIRRLWAHLFGYRKRYLKGHILSKDVLMLFNEILLLSEKLTFPLNNAVIYMVIKSN
jgi:hypothetical protein